MPVCRLRNRRFAAPAIEIRFVILDDVDERQPAAEEAPPVALESHRKIRGPPSRRYEEVVRSKIESAAIRSLASTIVRASSSTLAAKGEGL